MATTAERKRVVLDLSHVGHHDVRAQVKASFDDFGCAYRTVSTFWQYFPARSRHIPQRSVVAVDLSHLARHYKKIDDKHSWIASVRRFELFFVAFVRTKDDERYADLVDDLVRSCDLRISVCKSARPKDVRASVWDALSSFDPSTLRTVRYSPPLEGIGVEFSDGLLGFVRWADLGISNVTDKLILESVTVASRGRTVELAQKDGGLFDIDSHSIRALLDERHRRRLEIAHDAALVSVGQRVRDLRARSGLTQEELGAMSGIDQALISKLERGQHQPRYDTLSRIAAALGLSVPALLSDSVGEAAPLSSR
jgi:DNA-binding XRE family transcriptional regulator